MQYKFSKIEFDILREFITFLTKKEDICQKVDRVFPKKVPSKTTLLHLLAGLNCGKINREDLEVFNTVFMFCPNDTRGYDRYKYNVSTKIKNILRERYKV